MIYVTAKSCLIFLLGAKRSPLGAVHFERCFIEFLLFVCYILDNENPLCYKYRISTFRYVKYAYEPYGTVLPCCYNHHWSGAIAIIIGCRPVYHVTIALILYVSANTQPPTTPLIGYGMRMGCNLCIYWTCPQDQVKNNAPCQNRSTWNNPSN